MQLAPLGLGAQEPEGWVILFEPELHFGQDVLVPDLAGWRYERMPVFPRTAAFTLAPDWVCEVRSPSTATLDRKGKPPVYARAGVNQLWMLDPEERTLEVLQVGGEHYEPVGTYRGNVRVRATPFDAIELDLALLWA
jgi:Uma2 family endonuclease